MLYFFVIKSHGADKTFMLRDVLFISNHFDLVFTTCKSSKTS